jgi:hypothetical protein
MPGAVRMNPVEGIPPVEHEVLAHCDRGKCVTALMERRRKIDGDNIARKSSQDHLLRLAMQQLT